MLHEKTLKSRKGNFQHSGHLLGSFTDGGKRSYRAAV